MPNIKPEEKSAGALFIESRSGEYLLVALLGGISSAAIVSLFSAFLFYISDLFLPFTHPYLEHKLYYYFPLRVTELSPLVCAIFGGASVCFLYYLEKNIFIRRLPFIVRILSFATALTTASFLLGLISLFLDSTALVRSDHFLPVAQVRELPGMCFAFVILTLIYLPLCDIVRRRIFKMP